MQSALDHLGIQFAGGAVQCGREIPYVYCQLGALPVNAVGRGDLQFSFTNQPAAEPAHSAQPGADGGGLGGLGQPGATVCRVSCSSTDWRRDRSASG
jgi:hypothetical protein